MKCNICLLSKKKKTLRLGKIDFKRKSIWTMATSGRQAYAAHILEQGKHNNTKPRVAKIWIRLQTFWVNQFIRFEIFVLSIGLSILMAYFIFNQKILFAIISFFFNVFNNSNYCINIFYCFV